MPAETKQSFPRSLPDDASAFAGYTTGDWVALVVTIGVAVVALGFVLRWYMDTQGILEPAPASSNGATAGDVPAGHPAEVPADS